MIEPSLILVCGSRSWEEEGIIRMALAGLRTHKRQEVIHGGARGADRMAAQVAKELGYVVLPPFLPNWDRDGRSAGFERNLEMLDQNPDIVVAFHRGGSGGTKHTIHNARKRGILVSVFTRP